MFNKTTNYIFNRYGEVINELSQSLQNHLSSGTIKLKNRSFDNYHVCDHDTYIQVISGIVMLVVSTDDRTGAYEKFVIHRVIRVRPGVKYNFLCISQNAKVKVSTDRKAKQILVPTIDNTPIEYEPLIPTFEINEIYGYYYQVRNSQYSYANDKHNFWELTFIDNGTLSTTIDDEEYQLNNFDLILYAPNQEHSQETGSEHPCSYLTILFDMNFIDSFLITNRVYHANREIHAALNNFIKVSDNEFLYDSELMLCYLKELILKILQYDFYATTPVASSPMQQKFENELLNEIITYINDHIFEALTIEEICTTFSISRSSIQSLFKNNLNVAPKQYISDLKLNKSKLLIKESIYTISEISDMLGFASIHYFSRKFKQQFGITPSDYAKTIYN